MSGSRPPAVVLLASILLIGSALRIWAGLAPGSLWFDELATALNVRGRGWSELLAPLGYRQIVPLGFLVAEMAGSALLGAGETGLRLFPILASVASLLLFWRLASRFLSGAALSGAVAVFAVSPALVWYARKAKQYAGDVGVTLVLLLLAIRFLEDRGSVRRAGVAGAVGLVAILFSHPAVLVAAGLLAVLSFETWRGRSSPRALVVLGTLWGAGCLIQLVTTLQLAPPETQRFMRRAWQGDFFPLPWESWDSLFWLPEALFDFVGFLVGLMEPDSAWEIAFLGVYSALMILGAGYLFRSRPRLAIVLFTPLAVAIVASAVRLLPLSGRVMIYVSPTFLIACLAGVEALRDRLGRRGSGAAALALVAAPAAFLPLVIPTLNRQEDAGAVLRQVRERWREGDRIYVYEGATQAFLFYGEPLGLSPWVAGTRSADARSLLGQVDTLRGHPRAWFFYVHATTCRAGLIRSYLETIGTEIDRIADPHGVRGLHETAASLYDLSDPARLRRSSAAGHPPLDRDDPRCRGGEPVGARIRERLRALVAETGL